MTHFSINELIVLHNHLAARYGQKQIPIGTKISFDEIASRIEAVQHKA
jgi:hypothetical protein